MKKYRIWIAKEYVWIQNIEKTSTPKENAGYWKYTYSNIIPPWAALALLQNKNIKYRHPGWLKFPISCYTPEEEE